ncbi:MAG: hypothetical protein ABIJ04_03725 [Bacteroidota bacterium]
MKKPAINNHPINDFSRERWRFIIGFKGDATWDHLFATLEATNLGLHTHQMGGFSAEKAVELFEIPDGKFGQPLLLVSSKK